MPRITMQNKSYIVVIDRIPDKNWYTYRLVKELANHTNVIIYAQKSCNIKEKFIKNVWTPYLYFLEILGHIIKDRPKVVNLQFEFTMFGHVINSFFIVLLLYLLRYLFKIKIVTTLHMVFPRSDYYEYLRQLIKVDKRYIEKLLIEVMYYYFYITIYFLIKVSNKIIVHGNIFKIYLSDYINHSELAEKVEVIPHGVEQREPCVGTINNRFNREMIVLLFYGVISPRKGYDEILRHIDANILSSVLIIIAGKVPHYYRWYLNYLLDIINSKKIKNVILIPYHIPYKFLPKLYSYATFTVLPYKRIIAASGVLSESLEFCVPAIVSSETYFYEVLGKKYLFFSNDFNIEVIKHFYYLLRKNRAIINDTIKYIEMIRHKYSWNNVAKMYLNILNVPYNDIQY
jgi:glycosyltransferase involved in cell wall biosynthesis